MKTKPSELYTTVRVERDLMPAIKSWAARHGITLSEAFSLLCSAGMSNFSPPLAPTSAPLSSMVNNGGATGRPITTPTVATPYAATLPSIEAAPTEGPRMRPKTLSRDEASPGSYRMVAASTPNPAPPPTSQLAVNPMPVPKPDKSQRDVLSDLAAAVQLLSDAITDVRATRNGHTPSSEVRRSGT